MIELSESQHLAPDERGINMEYGSFLKRLIRYSVEIVDWPHGLTDVNWEDIGAITSVFDFGCSFDNEGVCLRHSTSTNKNKKGCCGGCANSTGHYYQITSNEEDLELIASLFDREDGFWREGEGCALPRKLRSLTCLSHYCANSYTKAIKEVKRRREANNSPEMLRLVTHLHNHRVGRFNREEVERLIVDITAGYRGEYWLRDIYGKEIRNVA
jgi:hypothetical protein